MEMFWGRKVGYGQTTTITATNPSHIICDSVFLERSPWTPAGVGVYRGILGSGTIAHKSGRWRAVSVTDNAAIVLNIGAQLAMGTLGTH